MATPDPGSFRDPSSHVVIEAHSVTRLLDERGLSAWKGVADSGFLQRAVADGRIVDTQELAGPPTGTAGALRHPRLATITYPYEWTFSMLKDAALLQLDLLRDALADGITIKDATPFNVQFVNNRPLFIDVGSLQPYQPGEPWIGYRQFTRQFLFPLMLRAWVGVPFQPWLRGDMEGLTAEQMRAMLPPSKRLSPAALIHVNLQARMEQRSSRRALRDDLKQAGFSSDLILANVMKLERLVGSLQWSPASDGWSDYQSCAHVSRDRDAKARFLEEILGRVTTRRVLDLGANDGHFSLLAEATGAHVVAVDGDEIVLDDLYRRAQGHDIAIVLSDLANPSPAQGWAGVERSDLSHRVRPDLVIAYGLIHHLIYTASIPPRKVIEWLRSLDSVVALEFVSPDDDMVAVLTANKHDHEIHQGRTEPEFRVVLEEYFDVASHRPLESLTRSLYELVPR